MPIRCRQDSPADASQPFRQYHAQPIGPRSCPKLPNPAHLYLVAVDSYATQKRSGSRNLFGLHWSEDHIPDRGYSGVVQGCRTTGHLDFHTERLYVVLVQKVSETARGMGWAKEERGGIIDPG